MNFLTLLLGKISLFLIQKIKKTSGSTWPGHIALSVNENFVKDTLAKNKNLRIILIAGTNGKTTTTKALSEILNKSDIRTIHNMAGANLVNGLASLLIQHTGLNGKVKAQTILFETDENSFPLVLNQVKNPTAVVLLNLFRDQLDRYGEINTTTEKWKTALDKTSHSSLIIANADDPQIVQIATDAPGETLYYSVEEKYKEKKELSHAVDSITCPKCRSHLDFSKISYSHIGNFTCNKCGFTNPVSFSTTLITKLKGTFNLYNLTAAILCANKVFDIPIEKAKTIAKEVKPAFGRQEEVEIKGKKAFILLSKNPTGLNESLKVVMEKKYKHVLIVLNDRIPDGRDISWIWDVDFEILPKDTTITTSGDRVYNLSSRLSYAELESSPYENLQSALDKSLSKVDKNETLAILPTYSAMLDLRKLLTGKKIL